MKAILESFSRCLGTNHSSTGHRDEARHRKPCSGKCDMNDIIHLSVAIENSLQNGTPIDVSFSKNSHSSPTEECDRKNAEALTNAKKASSGKRRRRRQGWSLSKPTSTKSCLKKTRQKCYQRKHDIFRNVEERSSLSKLIGKQRGFVGGTLLCFADPMLDSDDDLMIKRKKAIESMEDETISSTLYFDSKYEHIVELRLPMPLYAENSIMQHYSNESIINLFHSESHKPINSICLPHQPLSCNLNNKSVVDDGYRISLDSSVSEFPVKTLASDEPCAPYQDTEAATTTSCVVLSSSNIYKLKSHIKVIDDVSDVNSVLQVTELKLMINSNISTTTPLLTPIGSN